MDNCLPTFTNKTEFLANRSLTLSKLLIKDRLVSYNNGNTTSLTVLTILSRENRITIYVNANKNNNEIEAFVEGLLLFGFESFICSM